MKLSDNVLKKRVFKQHILDLHLKDFMLGQINPDIVKYVNNMFQKLSIYLNHTSWFIF